jgi:spore coat polysaccharide biosynthesis predicted glycosyltransferase SpsG
LNEKCMMVGPEMSYANTEDAKIFQDWVPLPWQSSPEDDAIALSAIAHDRHSCVLVLDHMHIDESYQLELKRRGKKWLQFDGAVNKPMWANLVVNANPTVTVADYGNLIKGEKSELLAGPAYAILRKEFAQHAASAKPKKATSILLTFGGGDDRGAILFSLKALIPCIPDDLNFLVISGRNNSRNDVNLAWIQQHAAARVDYLIDPPDVASVMARCALAVMAGGTTTYEANCLGIPMVLLAIAENQIRQSQAWQSVGQAVFVGELDLLQPEVLASAVMQQLSKPELIRSRAPLVDGQGARRVAEKLLA